MVAAIHCLYVLVCILMYFCFNLTSILYSEVLNLMYSYDIVVYVHTIIKGRNVYVNFCRRRKDTAKACIKNEDGETITSKFRSRIYDVTANGDTLAVGNTFRVLFEGSEYLVGDSGTDQNYSTSKIDVYNRICQYVAITRFLSPGKHSSVDLITGILASNYKDEALRNAYIENIRGSGKISITVNEENFSFEFERIGVRPEGSGITVLSPELFNDRNTLVIDLGGQNLNIVLFNDFAFDPNKMISENAGGTSIEQALINSLSSSGIENMNESLVRAAIRNKTIVGYDDQEIIKSLIKNTISKYIQREIVKKLDVNNINYRLYDVVFIGGTSFVLKDHLLEYFPKAVFMDSMEESQFTNCKGFYEMGVM